MNPRTLFRRATMLALVLLWSFPAHALFDVFLYSGRLKLDGANPQASDRFDLRFSFFDAPAGATPKLAETFLPAVATDTNGGFTVPVESSFFRNCAGCITQNLWLELAVRRTGGSSNYVVLTPRQRIAPVPTAQLAQQALTALSYTGAVSTAQMPASVARLDTPQVFTAPPAFMPPSGVPFTVGLTDTVQNLSADLLDGLNSTAFWRRDTNGGVSRLTEPANLPFEIRVQNRPVFRLQEGRANLGWDLLVDPSINTIQDGVAGSVAFGRGILVQSNCDYSVAGGDGNRILMGSSGSAAFGVNQLIGPDSPYSGIPYGYGNVVTSRFAGALGGYNTIRENSDFAIISGYQGLIGPNAGYSVVGGGSGNKILSPSATIGGGGGNEIPGGAAGGFVGGGAFNKVAGQYSVLGGGYMNEIGPSAYDAVLGGGDHNRIEFNAHHSVIVGGQGNVVASNAWGAAALGGANNVAGGPFTLVWGQQGKAMHAGSMVFADMSYADFPSIRANEFAVRAAGGVRLITGDAGLTVNGIQVASGGGGLVLPAGSVNASNLMDGVVLAEISDDDGAGSGLDADRLDGFSSDDFWRLTGNANTVPGVNFLGTTDNQALELKVDNLRALRLQPDDTFECNKTTGLANSPSLVGGYSGNFISVGVPGAIIAGGGAAENPCLNGPGVPMPNIVTAPFASILGGLGNANQGELSAIGGGARNVITSGGNYSHIANGLDNLIFSADASSILGGTSNRIINDADAAVIAGGSLNTISNYAPWAVISGGFKNHVGSGALHSTIGGGSDNGSFSTSATIGGGINNVIAANSGGSTIAGGGSHDIGFASPRSAIGGGYDNDIGSNSTNATIAGGYVNDIGTNSSFSAIGGGYDNDIVSGVAVIAGGHENGIGTSGSGSAIGGGWRNYVNSMSATIAGGYFNSISTDSSASVIGGGGDNDIADNSVGGTIAGGVANDIGTNSFYSAIGGGLYNTVADNSEHATIAGGRENTIADSAPYSTIGGGNTNTIEADASRATIAGGAGHVIATNADYATIPGGRYAQANNYGQLAYASGRFANTGDAQSSLYVLRGTTTDATQTEIFLDGASLRMSVPNGSTWAFEALVVGRTATGNSAGYRLTGVVKNVDHEMWATLQAPQVLNEDVAAWDARASVDNANDALTIEVTGTAATTIRWVASVRTVEVGF